MTQVATWVVTLVLLGTGCAASVAADAGFVGRWAEPDVKTHCASVRGFALKGDGTALVDWAAANLDKVEQHGGHWTSAGPKLHVSLPLHFTLYDSDKAETISMTMTFDGSLDGSGERLDGFVSSDTDHNIDGQPYQVRCVYVRVKAQ